MSKLTIDTVQSSINNKAEKRAREFVSDILNKIKSSGLLDGEKMIITGDDYSQPFRSALWCLDLANAKSPASQLYYKKYEQFIEEETKDFLRKVNELVDKADDLLNIANQY